MATLGSRSILGLWVETTAGAPAGQVIRPPAGTTVYVWDRQTGEELDPVTTGVAGHIDPVFYPNVDVFAVSTQDDYSTASTALPEETILALVGLLPRVLANEAGIANLITITAALEGGGGMNAYVYNATTQTYEPATDYTIYEGPSTLDPATVDTIPDRRGLWIVTQD